MTVPILQVALAQLVPVVNDAGANLVRMRQIMEAHREADLVVFPELFLGGYTTRTPAAQAIDVESTALKQLCDHAAWCETAVIFGAAEHYRGGIANSAFCINRHGEVAGIYRKTHLFGDEIDAFVPGDELITVDIDGHRLGLMICFDVEFPEVARALSQAGAEALVTISANMTPFGMDHHLFAMARAVENTRPHVYVNQTGAGETFEFTGGSMIVSVDGELTAVAGEHEGVAQGPLALTNRSALRPDYHQLKRETLLVRQANRNDVTGPTL
ncbi:carbon-nitrogen hydrolase family protein [Kushneria indalinina]|uniref:Putative amidohydrolase n=1 Tax=Kushneria indalinina DSM 14324 TaxID=1122140 RepID=A0A3D9DX97_9GAMM|nr:nitrilase-related carbon-nitrogen hydrolase [Kushneria indalinina]REC95321.1 putative amidohydrolase [Kushneria indalinina DSM 14324]